MGRHYSTVRCAGTRDLAPRRVWLGGHFTWDGTHGRGNPGDAVTCAVFAADHSRRISDRIDPDALGYLLDSGIVEADGLGGWVISKRTDRCGRVHAH